MNNDNYFLNNNNYFLNNNNDNYRCEIHHSYDGGYFINRYDEETISDISFDDELTLSDFENFSDVDNELFFEF